MAKLRRARHTFHHSRCKPLEQGTSQLADDGWAEAQRKIDEICSHLVDLSVAVEAIPNRVISGVCFQDSNLFIDLHGHLQDHDLGNNCGNIEKG